MLLTPREDILDTLFGTFPSTDLNSFLAILGLIVFAGVVLFIFRNRLILSIFSPELAASTGVNVSITNLMYFLLFALMLFLGLQFLGTVLVGALIIAPAAASRQISTTLGSFLSLSALFGVFSVVAGWLIAFRYQLELGPVIVCVATAVFAISLLVKNK